MKRELRSLTGLRGAAALYVVVHHALSSSFTGPTSTLIAHGYLAVDVFFVLSGFVMAITYARMFEERFSWALFGKFLGRRIARVYPLYVACSIAGFVIVERHLSGQPPFILSAVSNLLMVQEWGITTSLDPPAWSISCEWAAYLMFPALLAVTVFANVRVRIATAVFSAITIGALASLPTAFHGHGRPEALLDVVAPDWAFPVLRCIAEFSLGLLAYATYSSAQGLRLLSRPAVTSVLAVLIVAMLVVPKTDVIIVLLMPCFIISLAFEKSAVARVLSSPAAEFFGKISYSLYLIHLLLIGGVRRWTEVAALHLNVVNPEAIADVTAILINIPVAYLAYRCIELPSRHRLRDFFEGTIQRSASATPIEAAS